LVPEWLGWPVGWAYFTGCTYLAAALAMLTSMLARLAAALTALQIGLFAVLVWAPRAVSGNVSAFQWAEFVATCALTAEAWVLADTYRDAPWFAAFRRASPVAG
jgi:hypothetical protein